MQTEMQTIIHMQENPYGIASLWQQGDIVIKSVALLLLFMSIVSWSIILFRTWRLWQQQHNARRVNKFCSAATVQDGLSQLGKPGKYNIFRFVVEEAHAAHSQHQLHRQELQQHLSLKEWIYASLSNAIEESNQQLNRGLAVLASVSATAPFIGLFGTVWGIYHALVNIAQSGQSNISEVAGPVGEALTMTAFGLAVAIPALLAYNALLRGNKTLLGKLKRFAHNLQTLLLTHPAAI